MSVKKKNLDAHLAEIFKQFIAIKDDDFKRSQEVFKSVFEEVKLKMGEKCNYFYKYSSQVLYAGSVYDGIKVSRLDEFDMDIVIRLPINYDNGENGIIIENDQPGFLKMKIINAFDNLDKQPEWEKCHKVTREWRDSDKYFLQNKFRQWMHGIVQKALNEMDGKVVVNGVTYLLKYKESGPAYTLNIRNDKGDKEFNLDVDLVPVIRFMLPRWPEGYKSIAGSQTKEWLVVPKPNKGLRDETLKNRCWRLSFQDYEKELMKGCQQLKTTIRLVKKLRDALEMKAIASYYIKTLFLWKIEKTDKKFWQNKISFMFRTMVEELRDAIKQKNIPYFWHEDNNLIEGLKPTLQKVYVDKLNDVLNSIEANDVDKVVAALLTVTELTEFKKSEFYQKIAAAAAAKDVRDGASSVSRQASVASNASATNSQSSQGASNGGSGKSKVDNDLIKTLMDKIDGLVDKVTSLEDRMSVLEKRAGLKDNVLNEDILTLVADTKALQLEDYQKIVSDSPEKTLIDLY
ncbi:hypothetical protein ABMA28_015887 [Loxostege sticticalis]|uniref:Cyclic GMP-AMP synthase n=1 Tax=Loxostege sticticalis TaxID=481309 RepID=A0ABD0TBE4_LOXSC